MGGGSGMRPHLCLGVNGPRVCWQHGDGLQPVFVQLHVTQAILLPHGLRHEGYMKAR